MWYLLLVKAGQLFAPCDLAVFYWLPAPLWGSQGGQRSTRNNVESKMSLPECFPALSFTCHLPPTYPDSHIQSISPRVYHRFMLSSLIHLNCIQVGFQLLMLVHHLSWVPSALTAQSQSLEECSLHFYVAKPT